MYAPEITGYATLAEVRIVQTQLAGAFPDAASHYYHHGAAEGRDPGPYFSTRQYSEAHALPAGTNPIIHYTHNHPRRPA